MGKYELIYIWIEKYRNIKETGFNLSSNFDIKFNGDEYIIKSINKKSIYEDFINLRAIVGKNGSGKSTLIEQLLLICLNNDRNSFIIYYNKDNNKFFSTKTIKFNQEIEFLDKKDIYNYILIMG